MVPMLHATFTTLVLPGRLFLSIQVAGINIEPLFIFKRIDRMVWGKGLHRTTA